MIAAGFKMKYAFESLQDWVPSARLDIVNSLVIDHYKNCFWKSHNNNLESEVLLVCKCRTKPSLKIMEKRKKIP